MIFFCYASFSDFKSRPPSTDFTPQSFTNDFDKEDEEKMGIFLSDTFLLKLDIC